MDNFRLILAMTLVFLGTLIWDAWQTDYVRPKLITTQQKDLNGPEIQKETPLGSVKNPQIDATPAAILKESPGSIVKIETDVFRLEIDTKGGTLRKAELLDYPQSTDSPDEKFLLLNSETPFEFIIQSGILGKSTDNAPNHKASFTVAKDSHKLADGENELIVSMLWQSADGVTVEKKYFFKRGSYLIKLEQKVTNSGSVDWEGRDYRQLIRGKPETSSGAAFIYTYTGGAYYDPLGKFEKIDFDEMDQNDLSLDAMGGWVSMIQHYFIGALIPKPDENMHFYSNKLGEKEYILGMYGPARTLKPGQSASFDGSIWVGPKLQQQLEKTAPGLELTTDYGWLTIFAKPIFWILNFIHQWVGNWGWAIVILTLLIKLAFYRLSAASYRSMAAMRKVSPKLQAIKERYGDDKERFNKAMMELYQKEKVNPVGGCLPVLVQMPVFIALYWVLLESVELRDAPFIFWISNLSAKDPYFVLPIIMGLSMVIQQKLNPTPPDPMQAKIMMALPFIFTAMFAFFPAGLVLYWVVNNLISIAQQWRITQVIEKAENKA
ncbi:MAG: membrane protein insertase YidC [Gammaproteobacteria bacterium]|nr:membrane protein insertase YidC [Gammaproteobacteria bacterium]MBU1656022.1 membrane protein insertase YidC [Gammaproteobacteria bacterium]MBU1962230.1 membrane protein insertase YidC [Gammaproteobacteria bacterium]